MPKVIQPAEVSLLQARKLLRSEICGVEGNSFAPLTDDARAAIQKMARARFCISNCGFIDPEIDFI
ncbi:MAG: hypothetical protein M3O02_11230 [Acidobacteriota bacterium]|nr:hypothetical protein [Acidobacteriota bacterium]